MSFLCGMGMGMDGWQSAQVSDENNDTYTYYILHPSIPHITSTKQHKPSENLLWRFYVGRPGSYISIYTINSSVWIADCYRELNHYHQSHLTSKPPTRPALHTFLLYSTFSRPDPHKTFTAFISICMYVYLTGWVTIIITIIMITLYAKLKRQLIFSFFALPKISSLSIIIISSSSRNKHDHNHLILLLLLSFYFGYNA